MSLRFSIGIGRRGIERWKHLKYFNLTEPWFTIEYNIMTYDHLYYYVVPFTSNKITNYYYSIASALQANNLDLGCYDGVTITV